jgi:hypothetical protein
MASSYLNIITFLLTTLFYYMALKPNYTYEMSVDPSKNKEYTTNSYMYLAIYLLLVMVIQFIVNASIITSTCGGSITQNLGASGVFTFIPWTLIFGVMALILTIYPGFKSAFSDVIGYYWVYGSANKVITELLINRDVEKALKENQGKDIEMKPVPPQSPSTGGQLVGVKKGLKGGAVSKEQIEEAADTIVKICGNTSVLINQIVPNNFNEYWRILTPLMKEKYQNDGPEATQKKQELFELVVTRDNVGEAIWYIYTGLLLTSLVQLKMTTRGCASNPQTMEQNYQKFLASEQEAKAKNQLSTSTTYTITS